MVVILCATKYDGERLWHIKKNDKTFCGKGGLEILTTPIDLPYETKFICPECYKAGQGIKVSPL